MIRVIHKNGFLFAAEFACAARGYWLAVFPQVMAEIRRRHALAARIPDRSLRLAAQLALERKGANLEGAAAFATLAPRSLRPQVVSALVACQALCDYLDVLCEQPCADPVSNGYALHGALLAAIGADDGGSDYYRHHAGGDDGGYVRSLVQAVREGIDSLPSRDVVAVPLARAAERVVAYQAFNHRDDTGSYERFERWAASEGRAYGDLSWWEAGAGAGSTLSLHVLIGVAAEPGIGSEDIHAIGSAYFPWIGALHSLLDSLVDRGEDIAMGAPGLIDRYHSPADAAARMRIIAQEALHRACALPRGRRHALIVAAMTCFYLCELRRSSSQHARLVAPPVLEALGGMAAPSMVVLRLRRSLRARSPGTGTPPLLPAVSGAGESAFG